MKYIYIKLLTNKCLVISFSKTIKSSTVLFGEGVQLDSGELFFVILTGKKTILSPRKARWQLAGCSSLKEICTDNS